MISISIGFLLDPAPLPPRNRTWPGGKPRNVAALTLPVIALSVCEYDHQTEAVATSPTKNFGKIISQPDAMIRHADCAFMIGGGFSSGGVFVDRFEALGDFLAAAGGVERELVFVLLWWFERAVGDMDDVGLGTRLFDRCLLAKQRNTIDRVRRRTGADSHCTSDLGSQCSPDGIGYLGTGRVAGSSADANVQSQTPYFRSYASKSLVHISFQPFKATFWRSVFSAIVARCFSIFSSIELPVPRPPRASPPESSTDALAAAKCRAMSGIFQPGTGQLGAFMAAFARAASAGVFHSSGPHRRYPETL